MNGASVRVRKFEQLIIGKHLIPARPTRKRTPVTQALWRNVDEAISLEKRKGCA
jgi:hypothetical protein